MTQVMFALLLLLLQYLREHDRTRHTLKRDKQKKKILKNRNRFVNMQKVEERFNFEVFSHVSCR